MAETTKRDKQQLALEEVCQHEQGRVAQRKTLEKHFFSIEAEEAWLNELVAHGWRLVHYSDEEFGATTYTFESTDVIIGHYKLDFVSFVSREDFEDYEQLMSESGWQLIAENEAYKKLILFSLEQKPLFSDQQSLLLRDKRKRNTALKLAAFSFLIGAACTVLHWQFDVSIVMVIGLIGFVNSLYYVITASRLTYRLRKEHALWVK